MVKNCQKSVYVVVECPLSKATLVVNKNVFLSSPDALTNVFGNDRLVIGVNATASIFATYPAEGISMVIYFVICNFLALLAAKVSN